MSLVEFSKHVGMGITIKSRLIETDVVLLEMFLERFESLSGNSLDLGYLESATVRGFFRKDDLVAGYVLNNQAPHRLLMWIPEDIRLQLVEQNIPGGENSCCEITCMWKERSSISHWETNWVYTLAIYDAVFSGKHIILGGSFVTKLAKGQMRILDNIVYSGPSNFKNGEHCSVYFTTRLGALYGIIKEILVELKKASLLLRKSGLNT